MKILVMKLFELAVLLNIKYFGIDVHCIEVSHDHFDIIKFSVLMSRVAMSY